MTVCVDLLVSCAPGEVRGVLREDGRPVELLVERDRDGGLLDAIFLARLDKVVPSLPGAFLDIGRGISVFVSGSNWPAEGTAIPVQITKEARGGKPPEASRTLSLHGRLLVWTPGRPGLSLSRQIEAAERERLTAMIQPMLTEGDGLVVRSHAVGADAADLAADIVRLRQREARLNAMIGAAKAPVQLDAPSGAVDRLIMRAQQRERPATAVYVDAGPVPAWPDMLIRLDPDLSGQAKQIEAWFEQALVPQVALQGGGDIVIETTVAATMIDVNLGDAASGKARSEQAILGVNRAAAREIARQIRLRNLAGAIVIDFIRMRDRASREQVESALRDASAHDPARPDIHGWTRLGHLEMTRARRSPSLANLMLAPATPVPTPETVAYAILRRLARAPIQPGPIEIRAHEQVLLVLRGALAEAFAAASARAGRKVNLLAVAGPATAYDIVGI